MPVRKRQDDEGIGMWIRSSFKGLRVASKAGHVVKILP